MLFRRLAVLRQRLLELLFDAEGVGGGARPEFPQGMAIARATESAPSVAPSLGSCSHWELVSVSDLWWGLHGFELGAVLQHGEHDDGKPACESNPRLAHG